jgi:hypothetical protein
VTPLIAQIERVFRDQDKGRGVSGKWCPQVLAAATPRRHRGVHGRVERLMTAQLLREIRPRYTVCDHPSPPRFAEANRITSRRPGVGGVRGDPADTKRC